MNPIFTSFTNNYMSYLTIFCKQLQRKERFDVGHMVQLVMCKVGVLHP